MTKSTIKIDPRVWLFTTLEKRSEMLAKRYSEPSETYTFENSAYKVKAFRSRTNAESTNIVKKKSFLTIDLKYTTITSVVELDPFQIDGLSYDDIDCLINDFMHIDINPVD